MESDLILFLEAQGTQAPGWIKLLPLGEIALEDGRESFIVDLAAMKVMLQHFQTRGLDLVIDYEHQTLAGIKAPAAGWIKELAPREDGFWARVEWTETARRHLAAKEYRYFSPVLRLDQESRRPVALLHVALTNTPAINHLSPLVAKNYNLRPASLEPGIGGRTNDQESHVHNAETGNITCILCGDKAMGPKNTDIKEVPLDELLRQLKNTLGLKMEATGEEVLALADQRLKAIGAFSEMVNLLGLPENAGASQIKGAILAMKCGMEQLLNLQKELSDIKADLTEREVQDTVRNAIESGKIQPSQREFALKYALSDLKGFKTFVENAVQVLPLGRIKEWHDPVSGELQLTTQELTICEAMGIAPEAFKAQEKHLQTQRLIQPPR